MRAFAAAVTFVLGVFVAIRLIIHFWPRLFPQSLSGRVMRAMEADRTRRHSDVDLLSAYETYRTPRADEDHLPDRTWEDLDLEKVFATLDYAESEPGRQYLRALLRSPTESNERLLTLERAVERISTNSDLAGSVRRALRRLRDQRAAYLVDLFFGQVPARPSGWWIFPILTTASIACLAVMTVWPRSLLIWLGITVANLFIQSLYKPRVQRFIPAIHELPAFFRTARELGAALEDESALGAEAAVLRKGAAGFGALQRATKWLMFEPAETSAAAAVYDYVNLLFLFDVNAFVFATGTIRDRRAELQAMFEAIGYVDSLQSIATWRSEGAGTPDARTPDAATATWRVPEFTDRAKSIDVRDVVHPLLVEPVANSIRLDGESLLITGSNMSGKTTFIRTLGVNAVLAQTVHTVLARRWRAPMLRVRTSIGRADSVLEGKSYYFAEVESVLALVNAAGSSHQNLFLLDEIFRGTNTTERVAAAAAVLAHLDRADDIVVVATHDIEVLDLLGESYAARHFREQVDEDGETLTFDYRIQDGRSSTRNAIALLRVMKYPDALVANALEKLDWVERGVGRS